MRFQDADMLSYVVDDLSSVREFRVEFRDNLSRR